MPNEFTTNYMYDSNHRLIRQTGNLDSNTRTDDYSYDFYYGNSDSLIAFVAPLVYTNYYLCPGAMIQPYIRAIGGCGTYQYSWSPNTGLSSDTIPDPFITVGDTTVYTITVSDAAGLSATTQFAVYPAAQVNISLDTSSCTGCPVYMHATYNPHYSYHWYFNGNPISNADSSSIPVTATGNYYVSITDSYSTCTPVSDSVYYTSTTGIEAAKDESFSLNPNPSSGITQLKVLSPNAHRHQITITGATGAFHTILYDEFSGNGKNIVMNLDAKQFSPGIYIISVASEESVIKKLWVVER
jgi:YD repeat-containing protein